MRGHTPENRQIWYRRNNRQSLTSFAQRAERAEDRALICQLESVRAVFTLSAGSEDRALPSKSVQLGRSVTPTSGAKRRDCDRNIPSRCNRRSCSADSTVAGQPQSRQSEHWDDWRP